MRALLRLALLVRLGVCSAAVRRLHLCRRRQGKLLLCKLLEVSFCVVVLVILPSRWLTPEPSKLLGGEYCNFTGL